jgi:hypothetical protein
MAGKKYKSNLRANLGLVHGDRPDVSEWCKRGYFLVDDNEVNWANPDGGKSPPLKQ